MKINQNLVESKMKKEIEAEDVYVAFPDGGNEGFLTDLEKSTGAKLIEIENS